MKALSISLASMIAMSVCVPQVNALTTAELQTQVQAILAQITVLQKAISVSGSQSPSTNATGADDTAPITPSSCSYVYLRNLYRGLSGNDVTALQNFLQEENLFLGEPTGYFGLVTQSALQNWQSSHGIVSAGSPATTGWGVLGSRTRAAITAACAAQTVATSNPITTTTSTEGMSTATISTTTAPTPIVKCAPDASSPQTQVLACPTGQTGSITQSRNSSCATGAASPTWGAWITSSNTCKNIITQTQSAAINFQNMGVAIGNATSQTNVPKVHCSGSICIAGYAAPAPGFSTNPPNNKTKPRFLISRDEGQTFAEYAEANLASDSYVSASPNLVGDAEGNVYAIFSRDLDAGARDGVIMKFSPSNGFTTPIYVKRVEDVGYAKYSAVYDSVRKQIYVMTYANSTESTLSNNFVVIDSTTGSVVKSIPLTKTHGSDYGHGLQYANLAFNGATVYAAWPSCFYSNGSQSSCRYESIQVIRSDDGGNQWMTLNGTSLTTPVDSSVLGPTTNVWTSPVASANGAWLANISAQYGGILHFMFKDGSTQHYTRLFSNGHGRLEITPKWGGQDIQIGGGDGTFVLDGNTGVYAASGSLVMGDSFYSLGVIGSTDAGGTWKDVARAKLPLQDGYNPFAISAAREITTGGYLVGILTAYCANSAYCGNGAPYLFAFRTQVRGATPVGTPCTFNGKSIASGSPVTAYQYSRVAFGQTCARETRMCSSGTLSGSYAYEGCSVDEGAVCVQNGYTLAHGQSGRFYKQTYIPFGQTCTSPTYSLMRLCTNGNLDGSADFQYANCNVLPQGESCRLNGATVSDGQSGWFFRQTYVRSGQNCFSAPYGIQRMCTNGNLGGDPLYQYANCSVNDQLAP